MAGRPEIARENGKKGGRPKGSKSTSTLAKEQAREAQRQMITEHLRPLTEAHIENAIGIKHLMLRDPKTGKFERVKDEEGIDKALASDAEATWIYTKDPSVEAFKTLMDRALDKPVEQIQQEVKGDITIKWQGE